MVADDFYFAGHYLSEFGFIIVQFEEESGFQDDVAGSTMTIVQLPIDGGKYNPLVTTKYESVFTTTIGICKPDGTEVTVDEYNNLMLWLLRKDFAEFSIVNENLERITFQGTFNAARKLHRGRTIGFVLTFTADSPFGHGWEETHTMSFFGTKNSDSKYSASYSPEIYEPGWFYPDEIIITIKESGNLELSNTTEKRTTVVNGCEAGEILTLNGKLRLIQSDNKDHDVLANFNYCFPRFWIDFENFKNTFTSTLLCDVEFTYKPIVKVVV